MKKILGEIVVLSCCIAAVNYLHSKWQHYKFMKELRRQVKFWRNLDKQKGK